MIAAISVFILKHVDVFKKSGAGTAFKQNTETCTVKTYDSEYCNNQGNCIDGFQKQKTA